MAFPSFPPSSIQHLPGPVSCALPCEGTEASRRTKLFVLKILPIHSDWHNHSILRVISTHKGVTKSVWVTQASEISNRLPGVKGVEGKDILRNRNSLCKGTEVS